MTTSQSATGKQKITLEATPQFFADLVSALLDARRTAKSAHEADVLLRTAAAIRIQVPGL